MKNELALAPQRPPRTTPEQQAQIINESRSNGLTREAFARQQEISLSIRKMSNSPQAALECLVHIARGDSGQCRVAGNFLLVWWNAAEYGGFDLTNMWAVDAACGRHDRSVSAARSLPLYPDSLGYGPHFQIIARRWR
jgi:hypothetical protein